MSTPRSNSHIRHAVIGIALGVALVAPLVLTDRYSRGLLNIALIYVLLTMSFNYTLGYTGQISLGVIGFWAIGAYATGILTVFFSVPAVGAALAGVLVAILMAMVLARATARLRSHYMALATLGFGEIIHLVALNWKGLTHGTDGIVGVPPIGIDGLRAPSDMQAYYVLLFVVALGALISWRFQTSRYGRIFTAVKQGELSARTIGIDTTRIKALALVVSAVYASIAGSLYAHTFGFLSPDVFSFREMITVLAMLIIGGQGTVSGPIIGGILLSLLPELLRALREYYLVVYGLLILVMIVRMPFGITGLALRLSERRRQPLEPRPPEESPFPAPERSATRTGPTSVHSEPGREER